MHRCCKEKQQNRFITQSMGYAIVNVDQLVVIETTWHLGTLCPQASCSETPLGQHLTVPIIWTVTGMAGMPDQLFPSLVTNKPVLAACAASDSMLLSLWYIISIYYCNLLAMVYIILVGLQVNISYQFCGNYETFIVSVHNIPSIWYVVPGIRVVYPQGRR